MTRTPGWDRRRLSLTDTDQDVVKACLAGDADAYAGLVERYGGPVFNIALRITGDADAANDCAQDAFIRAYRDRARLDRLPGIGRVAS
jgi:RNA polymerase sigma-70 factor (ECF subfamily)